jgi:hemerythrin
MALITWDSRLALNLDEIDRQHQKLVAMINDLDAAMQHGKGKEAIGKILEGLVAYTQFHFGTEERLLEQHAFPAAASHKGEHVAFVKKISDFKTGYAKGQLGLSIGVMTFLSDWLRGHIMGTDRAYAAHLTSAGVR